MAKNTNVEALFPRWFQELIQMTPSQKEKVLADTLTAISKYGGLDNRPTKAGIELVAMLKKQCVFQGFEPLFWYNKARPERGEQTSDKFYHAWGWPTLLYKHKTLPLMISVNPDMEKDSMGLAKIPHNRKLLQGVYVVGIVG